MPHAPADALTIAEVRLGPKGQVEVYLSNGALLDGVVNVSSQSDMDEATGLKSPTRVMIKALVCKPEQFVRGLTTRP